MIPWGQAFGSPRADTSICAAWPAACVQAEAGTAAALAACAHDGRFAGLLLAATPITARQLEPVGLDLGDLDAGRRRTPSERVDPQTLRSAWDLLAGRFPVLGLPVMFVHGMGDTIVPARPAST